MRAREKVTLVTGARAGYEAMLGGRRLVIPLLRDRLMALSARLSPRPLVLAIGGRLFRPERA